ncbi:unnamed protein product [Closterium sp. NIES-54]
MTLRPSTAPQRVPLPSPPASSLPDGPNLESDSLCAASPTVTRFLATAVTDPLFESSAASALVAKLVDFAVACRLDYATSLVAESASASVCPPSVGGECALGTDVLEDRQEEFECFAAAVPHLATMDAEMASWKSTGTYVDEVPPPGANIVSGMWIFRVKRPPGSPPVFKAHYVAHGFSQRKGVDFIQTFSPTPKMTTLRAPREWHDTLRTTLATLGFAPSTADPSLFLRTDTTLPPFYVLVYVDDLVFATADTEALAHVLQRFSFTYSSPQSTPRPTGHSLSAPPSDESIELSGPYPELVGCLMYLMACTRPDLAYPLSLLARYVAPGRHGKVQWDAAKRVLRYLCSTLGMGLMLGGRARVVLTGHADASWELRWLTYLLTDLGEAPRSPPVLYVDNKAMLALCQEHRLEHRTKHIALRYFLARELQQRGQLRLAYVASQANSADVFTKALQPCDHQRFCTVLGLELLPSCTALLAARCPSRSALPCSPCAALLAARCPSRSALPCSPCAALLAARCPTCRALPCSPRAALLAARCPACRTLPFSPRAALLAARCPACCTLPCPTLCPLAARCPALGTARLLPCPEARTSPCPALLPTRRPALHPLRCPALLPARRPALQPARRPDLQPARCPAMQPARRPALQPASRPALQPMRRPALLPARRPALQPASHPALQVVRHPALQPACRPALQLARRPFLQLASRPAMQPAHRPALQPACCLALQLTRCPALQPLQRLPLLLQLQLQQSLLMPLRHCY